MAFTKKFSLNLFNNLAINTTIKKDGRIKAEVANNEPKIPADLNPAKVATFIPTGPGVILDTANISTNCSALYHL